MKIAYHCSPVRIEQFDYTNGVHFGGKISAFEACLRKGASQMFLHRVRLLGEIDVKTSDLGGVRGWAGLAKEMRFDGVKAVQYYNKYEPDLSTSYFVVEEGVIELLAVEIVSSYQAEKEIEKFHELMESF